MTKKLSRGNDLVRRAAMRLTKLHRRGSVRQLRSVASRLGVPVWLVGGALRDALDDRPVREIDVAALGCERLARALESAGAGTAVALSDASPIVFRIAGKTEIDCAEIEGGSIESDLARRDFTVNAMAWDLVTGRWLDPFGGAEDLAHRRLRLVSKDNLRQDPLRALRAARFMATSRLVADRETLRGIREVAALVSGVAPERIRVELVKLLAAPRVASALRMARSTGLLERTLGGPGRSDVSLGQLSDLDRPSIRRRSPPERVRLRLALLAAALRMSPDETGRWLAGRRFSREEAGDVAALLSLARRACQLTNAREEWGWVRDSGPRRGLALTLLPLLDSKRKARYRRLARRRPARGNLRVTGGDLLSWLGISPGPRVGQLLRELEIEAIRGRVRSRRDARRWLRQTQALGVSAESKNRESRSKVRSAKPPSPSASSL